MRDDIEIEAQTGVLQVTETFVVSNPTLRSYVGTEGPDDEAPVTLRLSIPPEFDKVTFDEEFYGRQFQLAEHGIERRFPGRPASDG